MPEIDAINAKLAKLADGETIRFLNINGKLADRSGKLHQGMMSPDNLDPTAKTFQIWADALPPILTSLLGPRAAEHTHVDGRHLRSVIIVRHTEIFGAE
jgi:lysophospholipase L1-like esterase